MLDIAAELHEWVRQGRDFAVATVVAVDGSAPRGPGATLAVDTGGEAVGSVSGGCVEAAVYELCRQSLRDGRTVLAPFGPTADDPFATGLTCGGSIDVLVTPVPRTSPARALTARALAAAASGRPTALARPLPSADTLEDPRPLLVHPDGTHEGTLGGPPELDLWAAHEAAALLAAGRTGTVPGCPSTGRPALFVESSAAPPRLIVFGAVDVASALVGLGAFLGYRVTVCDARPVFATRARFPAAHEVVVDWPHRYLERTEVDARTVLCVLTHDPKFDVPLLRLALRLPVAYIGAMGSRTTHEDRVRRLRETGVTERRLNRLRSPIGLDLGARTPQETALSIAAEIVAVLRGGAGPPLTGGRTPIHHDAPGRVRRPELRPPGTPRTSPRNR
ncbi:XdhC family protein [Streptomyces uncialis]|uniref:XdhC family protein n=1 Tax=Streptomyces uncialis TaxID=1048205 RepID=UPI0036645A9E